VMSYKMDPEVKTRWVAALRSGAFKQTCIGWFNVGRHCCLNVLSVIETGKNKEALETPTDYAWTQISKLKALINDGDIIDKLIIMNDQDRKTFPEIADWIEENL